MKTLLLQWKVLGVGLGCVLLGGCASPFRPQGWTFHEIRSHNSASLEYCAYDSRESHASSHGFHFEYVPDPFLAIDE